MNSIINRIIRAAQLDKAFFQEVEADQTLTQEALLVVIIVSLAGGIGAFISTLFSGKIGAALGALIITVVLGIANYYIWSYTTYFIGTNLFSGEAEPGELLRVLGYASGPRLLGLLGFIPCLGGLINLAGAIWALVAGFFGVREALDLDTTETLVTVVLGWLVIMIVTAVVSSIFGLGALGITAALGTLRN
jgi:hypothetical protein